MLSEWLWAQGLTIKTSGMQGWLQLEAEHSSHTLRGVFQLRYFSLKQCMTHLSRGHSAQQLCQRDLTIPRFDVNYARNLTAMAGRLSV